MPTISVVVTGRVQGVGFRSFVQRLAQDLGVSGEVWNTRGGAVEAIVQHPDASKLDEFRTKMRFGPGRVDKVVCTEYISAREYTGFEISYTR